MEIVHDAAGLNRYISHAVIVSGTSPVLIDRYLQNAIEVDVDAVADGRQVDVAGIMEHIEEAGIHSGDSACSLPPYSLGPATIAEIEAADCGTRPRARRRRADECSIRGAGRRDFRPRGQSARLAHGAVRRQGHRRPDRKDRGTDHGRRSPRWLGRPYRRRAPPRACRGKGGGLPVCALPRSRSDPQPGDEIDRRSDGARQRFRARLCEVPARQRDQPAARGLRLRLGARSGQGGAGRALPPA